MNRERLTAETLIDLAPAIGKPTGWTVFGVDCAGAIYVATTNTQEARKDVGSNGSFPKSRLVRGADYRVHRWRDGEHQSLDIRGETINVSFVQPTPEGVLLIGARCNETSEGAEQNAVEYTWDGVEKARFTLGDGIEDVRTTPDGSIWVSYFDEGVFGGQTLAGTEHGPQNGCVRFDPDGVPCFFYSPEEAGTDPIDDAYALNVAGNDDAWLYFYSDFPIVHMDKGNYEAWTLGAPGAGALAIDGSRVLLFGGYAERNLVRIVSLLDGGRATVSSTSLLIDENGAALVNAQAVGVGKRLYLLDETKVLLVEGW